MPPAGSLALPQRGRPQLFPRRSEMDSPMGSIDPASTAVVIQRFGAVTAEQHPVDLLKALLAAFGCPGTNGSNAVDG